MIKQTKNKTRKNCAHTHLSKSKITFKRIYILLVIATVCKITKQSRGGYK